MVPGEAVTPETPETPETPGTPATSATPATLPTVTVTSVRDVAHHHLNDCIGRVLAKSLAATAAKAGVAAGAGALTKSQEVGLLTFFLLTLTNEADLRSWLVVARRVPACAGEAAGGDPRTAHRLARSVHGASGGGGIRPSHGSGGPPLLTPASPAPRPLPTTEPNDWWPRMKTPMIGGPIIGVPSEDTNHMVTPSLGSAVGTVGREGGGTAGWGFGVASARTPRPCPGQTAPPRWEAPSHPRTPTRPPARLPRRPGEPW